MRNRSLRWSLCILLLTVLLLVMGALSLSVGTSPVSLKTIPGILAGGPGTTEYTIFFRLRLPRVLLGMAVGGALSLAGVMLQGVFRNPLVEPYTLGISGGAALGVCLNILLRLTKRFGAWTLSFSGFAGAFAVILFISLLMIRKRALRLRDLLLIGVMISFVCSSLVMLIMAVSRVEDLHGIVFWLMGSLEESNLFLIGLTCFASVLSLAVALLFSLSLNALALGEEEALHLGVRVESTKQALFLLASLTTGLSVAVAGVIGFVGLVVPHFMRFLVGSDHRILLPACWLGGAVFLILCDTIARTVMIPTELPVGVITGIIGGTLFICALSRGSWQGGRR